MPVQQFVYWTWIITNIQGTMEAYETCQHQQPQQCAMSLDQISRPSYTWQPFASYLFSLDGYNYLGVTKYYSDMPILHHFITGQCNAATVITLLKKMFTKHEILETLRMDSRPQYAKYVFADFASEWSFAHETGSTQYHNSNGLIYQAQKTGSAPLSISILECTS